MNINKLFRLYKSKLLVEAVLNALLFGILTGAIALTVLSTLYHVMIKAPDPLLFFLLPIGVFGIGFALAFFIKYYPNNKKVAERIDEIGLYERIGTMLEYRDEHTSVADLQRQDALNCLKRTSPKQLPLKIAGRSLVSCLVCVCLAVIICLVPYDLFGAKEQVVPDIEREQMIKDLIEELRQEAENDAFDEDLKSEIKDIIDKTEEDLNNSTGGLEDGAIIEDAKDQIKDVIDKAVSKDEIGEALQRYELTRMLGEAISEGNTEKVTAALDALEEKLKEEECLIATLFANILAALADSGVKAGDDLFDALYAFAQELSALFECVQSGEEINARLTTAFDNAEAAIIAALKKQAAIEEAGKELDDTLSDAKNEVLGNENEESKEPEKSEGPSEEQSSEQPGGGQPEEGNGEGKPNEGDDPKDDPGEGEGEGGNLPDGGVSEETMTEGIYDPISGKVTYGEVFAAYYAEYLKALSEGTVAEDLKAIMDAYFNSLNQ